MSDWILFLEQQRPTALHRSQQPNHIMDAPTFSVCFSVTSSYIILICHSFNFSHVGKLHVPKDLEFIISVNFRSRSGTNVDNLPTAPMSSDHIIEETEEDPPESPVTEDIPASNVRLHPDVPSQSEMPLPAGWAMQVAHNGRVFFIDHNRRITSWVSIQLSFIVIIILHANFLFA